MNKKEAEQTLPMDEHGSIVLPSDAPPKNGRYEGWYGMQHHPDLIEEGNDLGQMIRIDDDADNGLDALDGPNE